MDNTELTPEQTLKMVELQSSTLLANPVLQGAAKEAVTPMGPEQAIDPVRNTQTQDAVISGVSYNDDYYTQIEEDYKRANETISTPILGDMLNPIANPAASVYRQFMYGGNIAVNIGNEIYRKATNGPADDTWTPDAVKEWLDKSSIAPEQQWRYFGTINPAEAQAMKADADEMARAMKVNSLRGGFENFAAGALAGLIDIDTPITLMTGGLSAGAKIGINASRAGRLLTGTIAGGAIGGGLGAIDYAVNPTSDAESVALMAIMGAGMGMVSGGLSRGPIDAAAPMRERAADELGRQMAEPSRPARTTPDGAPLRTPQAIEVPVDTPDGATVKADDVAPTAPAPQAFDPEQVEFDPMIMTGGSSIGARQVGNITYDGQGRAGLTNKESRQMYDDALTWKRTSQAVRDYEDPGNMGNPNADFVVDKAVRFQQAVNAIGAGTDFDTLMRSGLATAQKFASLTLESASGIGRSQTNAAVIKDSYHRELVQAIRPVQQAFKEWHFQEQGFKMLDWLRTPVGTGAWRSKNDFHEEVIKEQMARRFGGQGTNSAAAKRAADAVEQFYTKDYEVGLGNKGQTPVAGYDQFTREPGYVTQQWSGRKLSQAIEDAAKVGGAKAAKQKRKDFINALDEEYGRLHGPGFDAVLRRKIATAVIDRALASRRGFKHDLIGLLRGDEGDFIRAALSRNGVSDKQVDKVIESIVGSRAQKTQQGHTQSRTDVDFRSTASNGIRMMDMLETDMDLLMASRANRTSGMAALARMGIPDRVSYEKWKKAILDEQASRGKRIVRPDRTVGDRVDDFIDKEPEVTEELIDAIYGYFSGNRPGAGQGADAVIQRIKKLTRLSLMNQLGLTSLAEHGAIAGTVGLRRWFDHVGQDVRNSWSKVDTPLNKELRHFAFFESEESLFNGRLLHELDKGQAGELMSKLDSVLNKGLEVQGYLSGYHSVVGMQQRIAISSVTARIFEGFKAGKGGLSAGRMQDLGLSDAFMARVSALAKYDTDTGALVKLNMDQWNWEDVQTYQQVMSRNVNQLVQKAMAGESNWAFSSSGIAQLFMQFKSFPLLAVHKQFARNARMADMETVNTFFFGLVAAGAAFTTRQAINGQTQNLTAEKIAKGALNYSNMTGWIPMFVDPVLNAAGADFDTSGYSSHGVGSVISLPASFGTMEKLVQLPFMPAKLGLAAVGATEIKNSDIRVIQSTPILGNAYGINMLLNMAKEDPKPRTRPSKVGPVAPTKPTKEFDPVAAALDVIQPPQ